jgi:pimeloyl-ACP methyl ester carboxylesterase
VLGHSLLCDRRMWDGVLERLDPRFRVFNVDVRGHGRSTAPGPFTLEDLAEDWRAILDAEEAERAILCGLSMGAMTAMRLALAAPERVAAMVLLDTSADPQPAWERVKFAGMAAVVERFGFVRAISRAIAPVMFGRTSIAEKPDLVERQMDRVQEHDPKQLVHAVRAVLHRGSIYERLGELRAPTLVVCGAEDQATPLVRSLRLAHAIADARLEVVPRAGHLSAIEQPERVARAVNEFLARVAP